MKVCDTGFESQGEDNVKNLTQVLLSRDWGRNLMRRELGIKEIAVSERGHESGEDEMREETETNGMKRRRRRRGKTWTEETKTSGTKTTAK